MKTKVLMKSLIFALTLSSSAFAGFGAGNGGGTQFCQNPIGNQLKYEVYDLKEIKDHILAERRRRIVGYDGTTTKEEYFERALSKVKRTTPELAEEIEEAFLVYQTYVQGSGSYALEEVRDVEKFSIDKNCEYKQVVNWIDSKDMLRTFGISKMNILRDDVIYNQLDPLNQAAIDFHEAVYAVQRQNTPNIRSSSFVRMLTGQAFSEGLIDKDLLQVVSGIKNFEKGIQKVFFSIPKGCSEEPTYTVKNNDRVKLEIYDFSIDLPDWSGGKLSQQVIFPNNELVIDKDLYKENVGFINLSILTYKKVSIKVEVCGKKRTYPVNKKQNSLDLRQISIHSTARDY